MGCVIRAHLEYLDPAHGDGQSGERVATFEIARDYLLFSILAGVRSERGGPPPVSVPRGLPHGTPPPSYEVDDELADLGVDGYCSREDADLWVQKQIAEYLNESKTMVSDPDAHSASWLEQAELEEVARLYKSAAGHLHVEFAAIVGAVRALNDVGRRGRFVFWFRG
jgi:hypothetical protein